MSDKPATPRGAERLAKVIARAGVASRRGAEQLVESGRVRVNGALVHHPGHPVDPEADKIQIDDRPLPPPAPHAYFVAWKPKGMVTTMDDPEGRTTVQTLLEGLPPGLKPVGRLDFNTEGVLLFTNDGDLAYALTHPKRKVPKRYMAKVWRTPDARTLKRIERGVMLDDGKTAPCRARVVETTDTDNAWVEITVTEGKNHLVRRMLEKVGHPVSKLRRESFATISLRQLDRGRVRALLPEEVARLRDMAAGVEPQVAGRGFRYQKGFARPKPAGNKPLSKKRKKPGR